MCLLCDDEKAYQAYMNYLDAMERQGKAADPNVAVNAVLDEIEHDVVVDCRSVTFVDAATIGVLARHNLAQQRILCPFDCTVDIGKRPTGRMKDFCNARRRLGARRQHECKLDTLPDESRINISKDAGACGIDLGYAPQIEQDVRRPQRSRWCRFTVDDLREPLRASEE